VPALNAITWRGWRLNLAASLLAFATYFCMYAFRKPFAAASYPGDAWLGLTLKTVFVISQILGYTVSKYLGIRWVSEVSRRGRRAMIVGLVAGAELALLGFALLPPAGKVLALFLNGLPLGMIWGLVVRYLEGRRSSELLLGALSCSFIVASGIVKDVGRWLLGMGVSEYWMPVAAGLLFFPALVLSASWLDRLPDPDRDDEAEREARPPMTGSARREFAGRFLPGLALLLLVYLGLTAFRDFRDNYGVELFGELGYGHEPALFSRTELPVALLVLAIMSSLSRVRDRARGLHAVFAVMTAGLGLLGLATLALDARWLSGQAWMVCIGLGAYLAYVPFSSFLFDRVMAATRFAGTAVFAVNVADAVGYTGSVGMQLYKDLVVASSSRLGFFKAFTYGLSVAGCVLLLLAALYFARQAQRAQRQGATAQRDSDTARRAINVRSGSTPASSR
jgi:MFS family permease